MENAFLGKMEESKPSTSKIKKEEPNEPDIEPQHVIKKDSNELKYFECSRCNLREKYEYFGKAPPFLKCFMLLEDAYIIEDPFMPPKQGEILVIGSHCILCNKMICKDACCSLYYNGTFCIDCAKNRIKDFPKAVQEKLNKITN